MPRRVCPPPPLPRAVPLTRSVPWAPLAPSGLKYLTTLQQLRSVAFKYCPRVKGATLQQLRHQLPHLDSVEHAVLEL